MRKKFILICFMVLIFVIVLIIDNCSVQAAGTVSISTNKSTVYVGDEFTVSINLSGASVATLTTRITVDTSKVDYVSGPSNSNFSNGKVIYTWTDPNGGASPISGGTIVTFKFRAKVKGIANFTVSGDFYDANENRVSPAFSGKSVTISEVASQPSTPTEQIPTPPNNSQQTPNNQTGSNSSASSDSINTSVSSNAFVKSLQLDVEGISPKFSRNIIQYYLIVSNFINDINVNAIAENSGAKVNVTGNIGLKVGLNKITI